jgi:two-component system, chemotaxis family, protein-glutamate methylesterase/glutaminase
VELAEKIRAAARVRFDTHRNRSTSTSPPVRLAPLAQTTDKIIAIGASTGGTEAIKEVLLPLPQNTLRG